MDEKYLQRKHAPVEVGQLIFAKISYRKNQHAYYPRPYIVIAHDEKRAVLVPCSSIEGKEEKYHRYPGNTDLKYTNSPPLPKASFARINDVKILDYNKINKYPVIHVDGQMLRINPKEVDFLKDTLCSFLGKRVERQQCNTHLSHHFDARKRTQGEVMRYLLSGTKGDYYCVSDIVHRKRGFEKPTKSKKKKSGPALEKRHYHEEKER